MASRLAMLRDLDLDRRAQQQRWKRNEARILEILDIRDAISDDLIDAIGADADLPAGLRADLPEAYTGNELPMSPDAPPLALDP